MKKIPYGISNFETIKNDNYYYVDKTNYIEILENFNERYIIFLRPRRFGKSLFISLLDYYYDIKQKNTKLFDDLYIGKNPTQLRNSYYTLTFTFSGINTDTEENTKEGFKNNIIAGIRQFLIKYNLDLEIDSKKTAADISTYFFSEIIKLIDGKIYLLIDKYDQFSNELLGFNYEFFKNAVSKNGFVRKVYETIKEATRTGLVDRIFITGVSPITMDSMTSGFNIASNVTRENEFNEILGFTEEEVIELSKVTIGDEFDIKEKIEKLRNYYNGYLFNIKGKRRVYNSDMILYYMSHYQRKREEPMDLVDRNVVSDYSKIGRLFEIGGDIKKRLNILKNIVRGKEQDVEISDQFNLENELDTDDFKSLLFYMGFVTIKRYDEIDNKVYFDVPNYVIKELYFAYFKSLIEKEIHYKIDNEDIRDAISEIAKEGTLQKLIKLTEDTLHRLANRDFLKFDEKYIQVIMLSFLFKSNVYYAKSEYEVEDGFIDIVSKKGTAGKPKYYSMIELKYIPQKEYTEELVNKKVNEAMVQLEKYIKSDELKNIPNLRKWAVVFCNEKCVAVEELKK